MKYFLWVHNSHLIGMRGRFHKIGPSVCRKYASAAAVNICEPLLCILFQSLISLLLINMLIASSRRFRKVLLAGDSIDLNGSLAPRMLLSALRNLAEKKVKWAFVISTL